MEEWQDRIQQAKEKSLQDIMSDMGYAPANENESRAKYYSPFRAEDVPSFILYKNNNSWYDWGATEGGDVIDFVRKHEECDFTKAVGFLLRSDLDFKKHSFDKTIDIDAHKIEIKSVGDITNKYLIKYAESRAISEETLKRYCKQVEYSYKRWNHVTHIAIGFENNKGGWEFRNEKQKVSNEPKSWRTVRGESDESCIVFEGFFDFLSYMECYQRTVPKYDTFILNGLAFVPFVADEAAKYNKTYLYLDNDAPAQQKIDDYFTGDSFVDMRHTYYNFEDFNDYVKHKLL